MKALLLVNRVWDLVSGKRIRPNPPPALVFGEGVTNQAAIDEATKRLDDFEDAYNKAACLIAESISDAEILSVTTVLEDPVATWDKLRQKFARRSEMGQEAAQMALLHFQHIETETADETITRYEAVLEKCAQQGVDTNDLLMERMILSQPNDRYMYLKKSYQHSKVKQNLEEIFSSMRDDDAEYQKSHATPLPGSAAFADAIRVQAELLWAQRSKDASRPSGGRPAASHTVCYCCGDKGHYAKDCKHSKSQCQFCHKVGHLEKACRQKQQREAGGPSGEASFFHGGYSAVAELESCDFHHDSSVSLLSVIPALQNDATMGGEVMAANGAVVQIDSAKSTTFLGDTGASHHIVHKRGYFSELSPLPGPFHINQVQGKIQVTYWGTVMVEVDSAIGKQPLRLTNVLLIESMEFNILSLQKMRAAGFIPVYAEVEGKVVIKKRLPTSALEQVALLSKSIEGRLTLDCKILSPLSPLPSLRHAEAFSNSLSMDLLHRRLGHSGEAALHRLLHDNMATGIGQVFGTVSPCDPCKLGKLTRPPHPAVAFNHNTTYALELVVMDLAGPVKPSSLGGASYFLGILDVFTRHSWVFTIRKKYDAAAKIMEWKSIAEGQSKTKLLKLRSDNGGEFTSAAFQSSMALQGVELQTTPPRSPESNGLAERFNRTLQDKTRTIMAAASLPGYL